MSIIVKDGPREAPAAFVQRLRAFDPDLIVFYNPIRHRWSIEQCTEHLAPGLAHSHVCRRTYVMLIRDPEGNYLSLDHGDRIFEQLAQRDVRRAGYETTPEGAEKFKADAETQRLEDEVKRDQAAKETVRLSHKDEFLTMNKLKLLLDKHELIN